MIQYERKNNPYTLQFSYIPPQFIERKEVTFDIVDNFIRDLPTYRGVFITGVRGCGKTVMLGDIRNKISADKSWIAIDINPQSDILESIASGLYLFPEIKSLFVKARLDFSLLGIGVHIENAALVASTVDDAVRMMLNVLKKVGKKVLITIDEVTYNKDISRFSHAMSSFANADYDIYVLMTGLLENIKSIKNDASLTFLYRAKVQQLDRLNRVAIKNAYKQAMELSDDIANNLAGISGGYSLAFQALGYHYWNELCRANDEDDVKNASLDKVLGELDATLSEMAYDKIWSELSHKDKEVLMAICQVTEESGQSSVKVDAIKNKIDMTSNTFSTYRKRLTENGVLDASQYGYLSFDLPRFDVFVKMMMSEM